MSVTLDNCFHLTVDIVQEIHAEAIAEFGGAHGVRQVALLESAVAAPQGRLTHDCLIGCLIRGRRCGGQRDKEMPLFFT